MIMSIAFILLNYGGGRQGCVQSTLLTNHHEGEIEGTWVYKNPFLSCSCQELLKIIKFKKHVLTKWEYLEAGKQVCPQVVCHLFACGNQIFTLHMGFSSALAGQLVHASLCDQITS